MAGVSKVSICGFVVIFWIQINYRSKNLWE